MCLCDNFAVVPCHNARLDEYLKLERVRYDVSYSSLNLKNYWQPTGTGYFNSDLIKKKLKLSYILCTV